MKGKGINLKIIWYGHVHTSFYYNCHVVIISVSIEVSQNTAKN